jgi:hypothetical protein
VSYDLERSFHLASRPGRRTGGRRNAVKAGAEPDPSPAPAQPPAEDKPHPLARRMALAIECKRLIESGVVADAAAMARIAGVTRARMTQILNLNLLAPDLQEALLFCSATVRVDIAHLHKHRFWQTPSSRGIGGTKHHMRKDVVATPATLKVR